MVTTSLSDDPILRGKSCLPPE